jgi:hypothetical protein
LPLVLGLLPQPGLSAEAALARDLGQSICSPFGDASQTGGKDRQADQHQHCILCVPGCSNCAPPDLAGEIAISFRSPEVPAVPRRFQLSVYPSRPMLLDGSPPRGPPNLLLI